MVEIVEAELRKYSIPGLRVYVASDYDDIFGWVDAIIEYTEKIEHNGRVHIITSHIWVDFCTTESNRRIKMKEERGRDVRVKGFNLALWRDENITIPREVKDFSEWVMADAFVWRFHFLLQEKDIDISTLYKIAKGKRGIKQHRRTFSALAANILGS